MRQPSCQVLSRFIIKRKHIDQNTKVPKVAIFTFAGTHPSFQLQFTGLRIITVDMTSANMLYQTLRVYHLHYETASSEPRNTYVQPMVNPVKCYMTTPLTGNTLHTHNPVSLHAPQNSPTPVSDRSITESTRILLTTLGYHTNTQQKSAARPVTLIKVNLLSLQELVRADDWDFVQTLPPEDAWLSFTLHLALLTSSLSQAIFRNLANPNSAIRSRKNKSSSDVWGYHKAELGSKVHGTVYTRVSKAVGGYSIVVRGVTKCTSMSLSGAAQYQGLHTKQR
ncbi:hypothetical protein CSKR_113710 [Clonorchis sinensis]|uniref:Uncharacterized protein n=1 Tax=Clonorchis sinensis TaxID=79923 RepID=A0A3R7JM75_CLOSI|nr:hypothetical protein CSKR_113710 [Clonorchis sinensis]